MNGRPLSRVKYEQNNPAVTVRTSSGLRRNLEELEEIVGLGMADILRIGLNGVGEIAHPGATFRSVCLVPRSSVRHSPPKKVGHRRMGDLACLQNLGPLSGALTSQDLGCERVWSKNYHNRTVFETPGRKGPTVAYAS